MPSSTVKQAKVMSALAHGWHPSKGSVAKIPVKVAKDFHAADAGHKYGKGMHKGDKTKKALRTAKKYASGGKAKSNLIHATEDFRRSPNIEDRRHEDVDRFHDSAYFPPAPVPAFNPSEQSGQLPDALGAFDLDKKAMGFADGGDVDDDKQQAINIHPVEDKPSLLTPDIGGALPEATVDFNKTLPGRLWHGFADPIQKAIDTSTEDVQHLGEQGYEPQSIGPAFDAAMNVSLGSGAAPAEANALNAGMKFKKLSVDEAMEMASGQTKGSYPESESVFKTLKEPYPKNVAEMAAYKGYTPEEVANIKSHLLPGAQKAFDKHYSKIAPPAADPNFIQNYHTNQGVDYDKVLAEIESHLQPPSPPPTHPIAPKPKGKDTDIEDYYAEMEKQQAGPEWEPPALSDDPTAPENILHETLSPPDLEEKSAKLGLNTTAFHGTRKNFSEFQLPEEMGRHPEIGVHFGTLRAAIDRGLVYLHPLQRAAVEDNLKSGTNVTRDVLSLKPHESEFRVIPSRIGTSNPLTLPDLGTWGAEQMKYGMLKHKDFTRDEVDRAFNVKGGPAEYAALPDYKIQTQQIQNLRQLIESKGYDSIAYKNAVEDPGSLSYIIWNLNKARSFYAKFDPAHAHSRNLGAAIGGLSLVPLGLYEGAAEPEQRHFAKGGRVEAEKALPASHQLGMKVPKGGSMCANCKFLASPTTCGNKGFIEWNGKPELPAPANEYCCDLYGHDKPEHKAEGGKVTKKEEDPKEHEFINFAKGGLINSDIPGRTDKIPMKVPPGSYVLPADIPSALGQGNTSAGSEILSKMFTHSAYGLKPMTQKAQKFHFDSFPSIGRGKAEGGRTNSEHVPIIAAGGEYIIHPDVVKAVGHGDISKGHEVLDKFVLHTRKQHIKTLRGLKGPKQ